MSSSLLRVEGLSTGYVRRRGIKTIVSGELNLDLRESEVVALIGPNGSGKTTLLRCVGGMQKPLEGRLSLLNSPMERYSARDLSRVISVVLTGRYHPGHMSAERLVSLGRHPHTNFFGQLNDNDLKVIHWALHSSGSFEYRHRPVDELSDGEFQKVMIARALAQEPKLILLDEPAAFLDITRKYELMHLLKRITRENATTVLVTSHDLDLVLQVADRVWLMNEHGVVVTGRPEDRKFLLLIEESFKLPSSYFSRKH